MWKQFVAQASHPPPPRREQDVADVIFQRRIKLIISPESYGSDMTDGQTRIRSFPTSSPGGKRQGAFKNFSNLTPS